MATAKIVTWSRPDKDGQFPIGIKIWNNGKPSYIFEGHTLPSRDLWDAKKQEVKKSVPHAARLTNLLTKKLSEVRNTALQLETDKADIAARSIKKVVENKQEKPPEVKFSEIANQYLKEQFDSGQWDVYKTDVSRLKRFYEFSEKENITFPEINVEYLRRYTIFLRMDDNRGGNDKTPAKPISERTVVNHLLIIRTLWNRAINAGLVTNEHYPFGKEGKIVIKFPKSTKIGPNKEEIEQLEQVDLSRKTMLSHARNVCLISYYFAGMRITDTLLLKWSDFQNDRLFYKMSKNEEPGSLKIAPQAIAILNHYKSDEPMHDLVFPDLKQLKNLEDRLELRRLIALAENRINKAIKKVMALIECNKKVSPHKFRHAFAQRADEMNVSPKVLQKLYRHESILTTMNYQANFSHQRADDALEAVLGF